MRRDGQRKKMQLNREVVRHLSPEEAERVGGGISVGTCSACLDTWCCVRSIDYCPQATNHPLAC